MKRNPVACICGLCCALPSCSTATIDGGYLDLQLGGEIGFAHSGTNVSARASVDSLGAGGRTGAPYGRVELASEGGGVGGGMFVSSFFYDNQGTGTLMANYGNISAGTAVATDFKILNAKVGFFLSFDLGGIVFIRPGIAADMFFPDMTVETTQLSPTVTETIDDPGGVPLPYLQIGVDTGVIAGFVEAGYLPARSKDYGFSSEYDVESETLDIEAMVRVRPGAHFELFAGYRLFKLEIDGRLGQDTVDIDIDLSGFMFGGGFHW